MIKKIVYQSTYFYDNPRRTLHCALLLNGIKYESIEIDHSTKIKKEFQTLCLVLAKITTNMGGSTCVDQ